MSTAVAALPELEPVQLVWRKGARFSPKWSPGATAYIDFGEHRREGRPLPDRIRRSLHTKDKALAETLFKQAAYERAADKAGLMSRVALATVPLLWETAVDEWLRWAAAQGLSAGTLVRYRSAAETHLRAAPEFAGRSLSAIDRATVEGYLERRARAGTSTYTRALEVACISAIFSRQMDRGRIHRSPTRKLRIRLKHRPERYLTHAELESLARCAPEPYSSVVRFAFFSGLRRGEIIFLRWDRVDLEGRRCRVAPTMEGTVKGRKSRTVPLNSEALAIVKAQLPRSRARSAWVFCGPDGDRMSEVRVGFEFLEARRAAGMVGERHVQFRDLRASFATWALARGQSARAVQVILGHHSLNVTQAYAHATWESTVAAAEAVVAPDRNRITGPPAVVPSDGGK